MKRRRFILGAGAASLGGSAVLGTGAFSRVESQRATTIQVAGDADAYLGLEGCPDSANSSYTEVTDSGHLSVEMSADNPTEAGGQGVNSNSVTWFDRVFQIRNQGKEAICVYIADDEDWPIADEGPRDGERRVEFYREDDRGTSIIGPENAIELETGEAKCIGIRTVTHGLSDGDELLDAIDNDITFIADVECPEPEEPEEPDDPEEPEGATISNVTFFTPDGEDPPDEGDLDVDVTETDGDDPTEIEWEVDSEAEAEIDEIVVFTGDKTGWFLDVLDDEDEGTIVATEAEADEVYEDNFPFVFEKDVENTDDVDGEDDVDDEDKRCPNSPGFMGEIGLKFDDYDPEDEEWGTEETNDTCGRGGS